MWMDGKKKLWKEERRVGFKLKNKILRLGWDYKRGNCN